MVYLRDVVSLDYHSHLCIGCGLCSEVCPHGVFIMEDKKAKISDKDLCMECGACMRNCPANAITVNPGVGCAYAVISSSLKGSEEISCDCGCNSQKNDSCC